MKLMMRFAPIIIIVVFPFLFLWPYSFGLLSPGNDFFYLYYDYKTYLISMLSQGQIPLWNFAEATGFPFYSNPFVQFLYPFNAIYLAWQLCFKSLTPWAYTNFTIASFSLFGWGLYCWLREIGFKKSIVLTVVLIGLMNLKISELIRFPNAANSAAWIPWILYSLTLITQNSKFAKGVVILGCSTFLLLTAGYPYFIIYTVILSSSYLLYLLVRDPILKSSPNARCGFVKIFLGAIMGSFAGASLAMPWLLKVLQLMSGTAERGVPDFEYATAHKFNWIATIGSWIYPPASPHEGWYYSGILTTIFIVLLIFSLKSAYKFDKKLRSIALASLGFIIFISYFSWGKDSLLFTYIWHHTPIINQMRVWGRINIVLVPIICLLLAITLTHLFQEKNLRAEKKIICIMASLIIFLQIGLLVFTRKFSYWTYHFKLIGNPLNSEEGFFWSVMRHYPEFIILVYTLFGFFLAYKVASNNWQHINCYQNKILAIFIVFTLAEMMPIANLQWPRPFIAPQKSIISQEEIKRQFLAARQIKSGTIDSFTGINYAGDVEHWGFQNHMKFYTQFFDLDGNPNPSRSKEEIAEAVLFFGADPKNPRRIFLTKEIAHESLSSFMRDFQSNQKIYKIDIVNAKYSGDSLVIVGKADENMWLSFIDNWDPDWVASLNGRKVPITRLFNSYKSIYIPKGKFIAEFKYQPTLNFLYKQ